MTVLLQTHFNWHVSFTEVANDIIAVNPDIDWEKGDYFTHIPVHGYNAIIYVGSLMRFDVARFYRYMFWTNKHIYYGVTEGPPVLDVLSMGALHNMDVYVPSEYVRAEVQQVGIRVVDVIPHCIDVERVNRADPRPWRKLFGDKKVVLYVAHRNLRKGFKELMEAWRMTRASEDGNVLLVLHTTTEPNRVSGEEWVDFSGNVFITENVLKLNKDDLYGLYKACDVYVHAALCEGFGIPIVEAMAAGKPVICIDAPPMNEHVVDKDYLVRVAYQKFYDDRGYVKFRLNIPDPKDFAEKIDHAIYSPDTETGVRNMERAKEKYKYTNYRRFSEIVRKT